jgi:hypothetical protein
MLQLRNHTPFAAHLAVLPDTEGVDTVYLTVKGTFAVGDTTEIAETQVPVVLADEYWGEEGASSLKYASEIHPSKSATDVVLVGQAWAPHGKPATSVDVALRVAGRTKVVRVVGDREWSPGTVGARHSAPKPFVSLPLVYERAFGGTHVVEKDKKVLFEPRNPVGRGFVGKRSGRELEGLSLPNLEDPRSPVQSVDDRPAPAAFGYVSPAWEPRKSYAGTYDEAWMRSRAPYLPKDFNPRFFNAAHPDLVMPGFLKGGERVDVLNASERGTLGFSVPECPVSAQMSIAGDVHAPTFRLETVLIEPDEGRACLTWRAAVACDKKVLAVHLVELAMSGRP